MKAGTYSTQIPVRLLVYTADDYERWLQAWKAWEASQRRDWSAWGEFEPLARSSGFRFPTRQNPRSGFFFGEAFAALDLHRQGFQCWVGGVCQLLHSKQLKKWAEQTAAVEAMLVAQGLPRPSDYVHRLMFPPSNPDLIAHDASSQSWRFSEVKLGRDRVRVEQLQTLAFLQDLLGRQRRSCELFKAEHRSDGLAVWPAHTG